MRILTIADAHLLDLDQADANAFCHLLEQEAERSQLIVLNGDVFDFCVGRQTTALRHYAPVLELIETAARKTQVVYIQGNHDFHLDGVFSDRVFVRDRYDLEWQNRRYCWIHGDTLGPTAGYRLLRRFLRSRTVRLTTEWFPPTLAWRLALLWSATSRDSSPDTTQAHMVRLQPAADRMLDDGVDVLFSGHNHLEHIYRRPDGKVWHSLGPWMQQCWYLITENGESTAHRAP